MLQKELAKRLRGRFETEPDGDGWLAVSSDGMPLCRVKYNGNCIVNDNPYLSEEYIGKIAEVQNELLTVKEYISLYEHAPQMKAADVSDYRQLASFGDTVLAATYSEKNGFMFCTWKQNADGDSVFWGDYSPNYEYVNGFEFTNRFSNSKRDLPTLFEATARELGIRHKLIRPYTPRNNGKVERSHREDQKRFYSSHRFYSFADFEKQLSVHNRRSNNFPMRPLGWLSPSVFSVQYV